MSRAIAACVGDQSSPGRARRRAAGRVGGRSAGAVLVVAVVVVVSGCYQLFPPVQPVDFCIEQARLYCDLQFRCCTAVEREESILGLRQSRPVLRKAPSSAGECVEVMTEVCRAAAEEQNEALREERITFDADEAVDCLDDLVDAVDDCDAGDFFDAQGTYLLQMLDDGRPGIPGDFCDNAIEGDLDEGDDCFADYECDEGTCLVTPGPDEVTAEGECQGEGKTPNPFEGNVKFEVCDGLDDEE
jgi:hypothetical protein